MNLLNKLTKKNLILNKKRTIVTIVGIILSVALITALSSLVVSFKFSALEFEKKRSGDYHVSFSHVLANDVDKLKNNRYIEDVYFSKEVGYSKLDGIKNVDKPFVFIKAYDYKALDKMVLANILEGRLPKTSDEIIISKHLRTNGRVNLNIGDTITLGVGKRLSNDEYYPLDQSNPYNEEIEHFKKEYDKEYKIVGIIERPSYSVEPYSAPGYTFITCLDEKPSSMYKAYVRYKHKFLADPYSTTANILGVDKDIYKKFMTAGFYGSTEEYDEFMEKYQKEMEKARYDVVTTNSNLISLEYQNLNDSMMRSLYMVAGVVALIIMTTSIYCIKNSFNISITEKTRQYGMLASVGATRKQIKRNVLYEALVLGIISIPIGIISGLFASFILIKVSTLIVGDALGLELIFKISLGAILLSILLGAITIYLSAVRSARKASKISPISAIRNSDDIKIKSKKIKSPKWVKRLFGIGGDVSYKNLKRNNKKYRTTVISIVVCVSVFIALYSFMNLAFKSVDLTFKNYDYNISVDFSLKDNKKLDTLYKDILNIDGIKNYSIDNSATFLLKNPEFSGKYREFEGDYIDSILSEEKTWTSSFISLGDYQYRKYIESLGLKYDDVKDKAIILNNTLIYTYEDGKSKKYEVDIFDYKKGDILKGYTYQDNCKNDNADECYLDTDVEVALLTHEQPFGHDSTHFNQGIMIVSDELMKKINPNSTHHELLIDVEDADKYQDEVEKVLVAADDYHVYNSEKDQKESKSIFLLVAIFLYGFIIVIALIGITNIFNTITTSVELRAREFATLKSVGMTRREFNRMISLESLFYGVKSLVIGIPIGGILSYLIYRALMGGDLEFKYSFPVNAVIISVVAVLILVTVIMKYSISKVNKQNTIETIRNDNI